MKRQRGDLVPIGEVIGGLGGPVFRLFQPTSSRSANRTARHVE